MHVFTDFQTNLSSILIKMQDSRDTLEQQFQAFQLQHELDLQERDKRYDDLCTRTNTLEQNAIEELENKLVALESSQNTRLSSITQENCLLK